MGKQRNAKRPGQQQRQRHDVTKLDMDAELAHLEQRIERETPARGTTPPLSQTIAFGALPLSHTTLRGLDDAHFTIMTDIQNACLPHALAGRDILGAARTGSGKTLAFLIPLLERLYRHRISAEDGPGAIVLSPTRELAMQIFQVLRKVGKFHTFSVGLLMGGKKDFYMEQSQVASTNIIIATPGRLLQHLEQTPYFDCHELKTLVLDEADRILDMGFREQLVRILDYLPKQERQTMLFSATQTRDVKHLATLSLRQPEYLGVHDGPSTTGSTSVMTTTPAGLDQSYVVVPLQHKLDAVYSFITTHLKCKCIVFMATCAQVRYSWELFTHLRPGVPIMALHGKLVQEKRTQIYFNFASRPQAVLFATDIAARGLDFKDVDWVVQVDAPEDRATYIHRVGRTARYRQGGKALLMLTEAEEQNGFVNIITGKAASTIPIKKLKINPNKTMTVTERAAALVAANVKLHELAKKAFSSYVRSVRLMLHKNIFRVDDLDTDGLAKALGLASTPKLDVLQGSPGDRDELRGQKNVNRKLQKLKEQIKAEKLGKKLQRVGKDAGAEALATDDVCSDDEVVVSKLQCSNDKDGPDGPIALEHLSRPRKKHKIRIDGSNGGNHRLVFADIDGDTPPDSVDEATGVGGDETDLKQTKSAYQREVQQRLRESLARDRTAHRDRVREKHRKGRLEKREENGKAISAEGMGVMRSPALNGEVGSEDDSSTTGSNVSSRSDDEQSNDTMRGDEDAALAIIRGSS